MLGDRRTAASEIAGELADGKRACPQQVQHPAPRGIRDRPEDRLLPCLGLNGNHWVTNMVTIWLRFVKTHNRTATRCRMRFREHATSRLLASRSKRPGLHSRPKCSRQPATKLDD